MWIYLIPNSNTCVISLQYQPRRVSQQIIKQLLAARAFDLVGWKSVFMRVAVCWFFGRHASPHNVKINDGLLFSHPRPAQYINDIVKLYLSRLITYTRTSRWSR